MAEAACITGAGSGIGRACALLAAAEGAPLVLLDIDGESAERVAAEARAAGSPAALALACDVSKEDQVERAWAGAELELGVIRRVFANAGIDRAGVFHELPAAAWQRVLDVNVNGAFFVCRRAIASLVRSHTPGSIVITCSPSAFVAFAAGGAAAYSASKAALVAMMRCLAVDYAAHGIRVNAIVPGATETPLMWANVDPSRRAAARAQVEREVPMGRIADPLEPARAAWWLLSGDASYVTGSCLVCDGGVLAKGAISF